MADRRELYRSPNGDTWFLGREPTKSSVNLIYLVALAWHRVVRDH